MKISFAVLLGALVALAGVSILLDVFFGIDLPIFGIALGLFLLYLGAQLIAGGFTHHRHVRAATGGVPNRLVPRTVSGQGLKYDVVFGQGVVDLTQLEPSPGPEPRRLEINVVFGEALVKLDRSIPYELEASSVFGSARMPDRREVAFSSVHYAPQGQHEAPVLRIKLSVVFGSAKVVEVEPPAARPRVPAVPAVPAAPVIPEEAPAPH